jgi:uncharacterized protein YuzE
VRVTFDPEANLAYISLLDGNARVGEAVRQLSVAEPGLAAARIVLDLDRDGRLIGIEVFDARESLPVELLDEAQTP